MGNNNTERKRIKRLTNKIISHFDRAQQDLTEIGVAYIDKDADIEKILKNLYHWFEHSKELVRDLKRVL